MSRRPNFLIVVADDLGFSDTAPYGSEIPTPTLDRLAREGVTMTGFHTASACSPTRAMLFSGTDNHIAGLGQMAEYMRSRPELYKDRPGYEGYLNWRVAALSEILQDSGYWTMMSGKWHLGLKRELAPCSRGFRKAFTYLAGAGNHYNNEPQLDDTVPHLPSVWGDGLWMEGDVFLDRHQELPKDFYSTKSFTDKFIDYLGARNDAEREQPFFGYLAFTAPHWPLQAPQETIAKYRGIYSDGPEALRLKRLQSLIQRRLVPADVKAADMIGNMPKEWAKMDDAERANSARRMETYAAMVDLIDQNLARVVDYLESTGELDNTFILFMSDNGAEGQLLEALPIMRQSPLVVVQKFYDNSTENIGNANSFVWYGPRWACAATAPSRGYKAWTTEGGIRCPCIVRYPKFPRSSGSISHEFCTVMDILPTVLDLAQVPHPGTSFRGRDVVLPRGRSWVPYLSNSADGSVIHDEQSSITGWELFGRRAIRKGRWKAVYIPAPMGPDEWELFNLETDLGETTNLANEKPEILEDLLTRYAEYSDEAGLYDPEAFVVGPVK
ncbi:hypothetical protein CLAIMM_03460 [Cladophialophora immunda]|nr:hypothetical protein CLAIMM_03460 [Cladophialophora immunda]